MNDERLHQLLRGLPREEASPGFTTRVLERLAEPVPARAPRRLAWVAVAAVLLAVVGGVSLLRHIAAETERDAARRAAVARLETLTQEKSELEAELAQLARLTRRARPVLYVDTLRVDSPRAGAEREIDLVIDLAALYERRSAAPAASRPVPAKYQGDPP